MFKEIFHNLMELNFVSFHSNLALQKSNDVFMMALHVGQLLKSKGIYLKIHDNNRFNDALTLSILISLLKRF